MSDHSHLDNYVSVIASENPRLGEAVREHSNGFANARIRTFTHMQRTKGLLFGEVQSGKTAHMFGIIAASADIDAGFKTFVLLTTNNRNLQQQTIRRAFRQLTTFNVCDESDDVRFIHAGLGRPSLVVLKKDPNVLKTWNAHFASANRLANGPIFILDDEADNASPNTKINQRELSRTFELIQTMRGIGTSSIYLQVTATPQALVLQGVDSATRPEFLHYFEPGRGYLGGSFFFTNPTSFTQRFIPESEKADLLDRTSPSTTGLRNALATFLVTCAELASRGEKNVNFLVHPSVSKGDHTLVVQKIIAYLTDIRAVPLNHEDEMVFFAAHQDLQNSCPGLLPFEEVKAFLLGDEQVKVFLLNSSEEAERGNTFEHGFNIIVGGNTLGRGVTFSRLQTVYYVRTSKTPQADTYWQHSRMFGYDRIPELMRVFMPPSAFRAFRVFHEANENLVSQLANGSLEAIQVVLAPGYRPTRTSVLDRTSYSMLVGGTNYFPNSPREDNLDSIRNLVGSRDDSRMGHLVEASLLGTILGQTRTGENGSWPAETLMEAIQSIDREATRRRFRLLLRFGRKISRDTGTLLSPDDRALGKTFEDETVLTLYQVTGEKDLGWSGAPFWIPNVRLPEGLVFHRG
jgi:hypothetical protein